MDVIDRLIAAVRASGMKQNHIALTARMDKTKLNKILHRKQVPTVPEFIDIARAIRLDPARLFTQGEIVVDLETLRAAHGDLLRVAAVLEKWLPVPPPPPAPAAAESTVVPLPKRSRAPRSVKPVGAAANPNAEMLVELESEQRQIPRDAWNLGARIIARAVGDSMDGGDDPIRNGELVYLKPTRSRQKAEGRVVLVRRDDGLYLKKFESDGRTIELVSANGEPSIVLDASAENLQLYGYVVAHEVQ